MCHIKWHLPSSPSLPLPILQQQHLQDFLKGPLILGTHRSDWLSLGPSSHVLPEQRQRSPLPLQHSWAQGVPRPVASASGHQCGLKAQTPFPGVTLVWITCCGKSLMAFVNQPSKLLAKLRMACVKVPGRSKHDINSEKGRASPLRISHE